MEKCLPLNGWSKMLDVEGIKQACENIEATFLEPAAGDGNS